MIDVQWEKAKHVTEHPHPGSFLLRDDKDAVWFGNFTAAWPQNITALNPYGSTSHIKDGVEGIRGWFLALVADLWTVSHWQQGNKVIIRDKEPSQQTQAGFTERIVFAQSEQLYRIIYPYKFINQYFL